MIGIEDGVRTKYQDVLLKEWYIEIWYRYQVPTVLIADSEIIIVGTGLFYKSDQEDQTKQIFESAKTRGLNETGANFTLVLRRSDDIAEVHDKINITNKHFEQITGLKALSAEEYYQKRETVPQYLDVGATTIDFLSLAE